VDSYDITYLDGTVRQVVGPKITGLIARDIRDLKVKDIRVAVNFF
jgi:hypothetical protein